METKLIKKTSRSDFTNQTLDLINSTNHYINEAIDLHKITLCDIKDPTFKQIDTLLNQSYLNLHQLKKTDNYFITIGLNKMFSTLFEEQNNKEMDLTKKINYIFKKLIENGFDINEYKYEFTGEDKQNFFLNHINEHNLTNSYVFFHKPKEDSIAEFYKEENKILKDNIEMQNNEKIKLATTTLSTLTKGDILKIKEKNPDLMSFMLNILNKD